MNLQFLAGNIGKAAEKKRAQGSDSDFLVLRVGGVWRM